MVPAFRGLEVWLGRYQTPEGDWQDSQGSFPGQRSRKRCLIIIIIFFLEKQRTKPKHYNLVMGILAFQILFSFTSQGIKIINLFLGML